MPRDRTSKSKRKLSPRDKRIKLVTDAIAAKHARKQKKREKRAKRVQDDYEAALRAQVEADIARRQEADLAEALARRPVPDPVPEPVPETPSRPASSSLAPGLIRPVAPPVFVSSRVLFLLRF